MDDIERIKDEITDGVDELVQKTEEMQGNIIEAATRICNLCNEADEYSWRECIEKIQDIAREFTP